MSMCTCRYSLDSHTWTSQRMSYSWSFTACNGCCNPNRYLLKKSQFSPLSRVFQLCQLKNATLPIGSKNFSLIGLRKPEINEKLFFQKKILDTPPYDFFQNKQCTFYDPVFNKINRGYCEYKDKQVLHKKYLAESPNSVFYFI